MKGKRLVYSLTVTFQGECLINSQIYFLLLRNELTWVKEGESELTRSDLYEFTIKRSVLEDIVVAGQRQTSDSSQNQKSKEKLPRKTLFSKMLIKTNN